MPRKRAHISWKTKYAAALLALGHVPYDHAKQMHEDQIIALYQVDHGILHAFGGADHFSNLTPRLIAEHRHKSKGDKKITSKAVRIDAINQERQRALLAKERGKRKPKANRSPGGIARRVDPWGKRLGVKRKINWRQA